MLTTFRITYIFRMYEYVESSLPMFPTFTILHPEVWVKFILRLSKVSDYSDECCKPFMHRWVSWSLGEAWIQPLDFWFGWSVLPNVASRDEWCDLLKRLRFNPGITHLNGDHWWPLTIQLVSILWFKFIQFKLLNTCAWFERCFFWTR